MTKTYKKNKNKKDKKLQTPKREIYLMCVMCGKKFPYSKRNRRAMRSDPNLEVGEGYCPDCSPQVAVVPHGVLYTHFFDRRDL